MFKTPLADIAFNLLYSLIFVRFATEYEKPRLFLLSAQVLLSCQRAL